jgi:hypothetical protein
MSNRQIQMSQQIEIADLRLTRSQKVLRIERALARTYIKIANQIVEDKRYPSGDINSLKVKYNPLVYDNTRAALSVISQISTRYVNEKTKTNPYATEADIKLIKEQTDKAVDSFWRKIQLKIQRPENDLDSYVAIVAQVAATGTLALTTRAKIFHLSLKPTLLGGAQNIYTSEEDYSPLSTIPLNEIMKKPKLVWRASLDERTCQQLPTGEPGCASLNGQSWDADDPNIPTPGELGALGTHPHCRCILDLVMPEDPTYGYLQ